MVRHLKRLISPRVILFVFALALLAYVTHKERQAEALVGCWDCGWEMRQAAYLVFAVAGLLIARWWALALALVLALKVLYTIGYVTFWNNIAEVHGAWHILKSSLRWSLDGHLEFFVVLAMSVIVICYAARLVRRAVSN
jgi:hypothetical protein